MIGRRSSRAPPPYNGMVPRLDVKISAFSQLDGEISAFLEKVEFLGFSGAAAQRNHRPQAY